MRKPQFEHFRKSLLSKAQPIAEHAREPYRLKMIAMLEASGSQLVQRARKDGHGEALIEIHGSWLGTDFSTDAVLEELAAIWPADLFPPDSEMHWIEAEDEVVVLESAASLEGDRYLTARVKVVLG